MLFEGVFAVGRSAQKGQRPLSASRGFNADRRIADTHERPSRPCCRPAPPPGTASEMLVIPQGFPPEHGIDSTGQVMALAD